MPNDEPVNIIVGLPTAIVIVSVLEQPIKSEPVKVYVVVTDGLSTAIAVVTPIGLHV